MSLLPSIPSPIRVLLIAGWLAAAAATVEPAGATAADARAHLEALTALGPRPSGSAANEQAARYLASVLELAGYRVEIQEGMAQSQGRGFQGGVRNVVAWLPAGERVLSRSPQADTGPAGAWLVAPDLAPAVGVGDVVLFAAHFDSVSDGPGATDDAVSVATLVAVAAQLSDRRRARPVLFLFTDGEERGLLGAQLFVVEHPLASSVGAVFNFDHSGRRPPLYAFETAAPNGALLRSLVGMEADNRPRAFSFAEDLYRVLPFGTDFTVFQHLEVPGLNFALVRDGYLYHTSFDQAATVPSEALETLIAVVRHLANDFVVAGLPLEQADGYRVFFPLGPFLVRLGFWGAAILAWGSVGAALGAFVVLMRHRTRAVARGVVATFLALPLAVLLLAVVSALIRLLAGRSQLAYGEPLAFFLWLLAAGAVCLPLAHALLAVSRSAAESLGSALALWALLGVVAAIFAPGSVAFFALPLAGLAATAWAEALGARRWLRVAAAGLTLLLAAGVWIEPVSVLLPFLVTTLALIGPEPAPFWPIVGALLGTLLASLLWGLRATLGASPAPARRRPWAVATLGIAALLAPLAALPSLYAPERPQRVWAYHVTRGEEAYWALASVDPVPGSTPGLEPGRETPELWWLHRRWRREVFDAQPSAAPRVAVQRTESGLEVDVEPPPGADMVSLVVEGMEVVATDPPTDPERLRGSRVALRQVVADGSHPRFTLTGTVGPETELLVMSSTVGFPQEPPFADRLAPPVAVAPRTLAYVEAGVP
jgi:hypothetical protein